MGYADAFALRQALEERLRGEARQMGVPVDRLRKEVAFQRFLARLGQVTPREAWALKGGMGLIARLGQHARGTRDIDTNWRAERQASTRP
ncbi:MAG: hypothetical protein GEU81_12395 [Nitriliruptorales bacterium]|nr:hypothetical protein [Nitriliruptorales bacterium]